MFLNLWDNFAETSPNPAPKAGFCHRKWGCMGIKVSEDPVLIRIILENDVLPNIAVNGQEPGALGQSRGLCTCH